MALVVGITGGIGSGKSEVTRRFEAHGIVVVDADIAARIIVEPGGAALAAIAGHFGNNIILADGSRQRHEFYWGSGFLSQSERVLEVPKSAQRIEFLDRRGKITRSLDQAAL